METVRRNSKKRQAIYDALCSTKLHPSAEQLYIKLKREIPDLSLGTVYRNLGMLLSDGLIIKVANVGGEERYDADTRPHSHFICSCCGSVTDYDADIDIDILASYPLVERAVGGRVSAHSLSFYGLCKHYETRQKPLNIDN